MLKEIARQYYLEQNYNCAETIIRAANDAYHLGLTEDSLKLLAGFGGGIGCGSLCGAVAGGVCAFSRMFVGEKAHETANFKEDSAALNQAYLDKMGSTMCVDLKAKYNTGTPERCMKTIEIAADILEQYVAKKQGKPAEEKCTLSPDDIKRVKALGFLQHVGTDRFQGRVITRNGKITARECAQIANAAEKFGSGEIAMTTRQTIEIQEIPYEKIDELRAFLAEAGLETGGTGSKVRPVVSCKGTTCQYGLIDTFSVSEELHNRFYKGYETVKLPHKFKIAVGGCPNNCVKPDLNDFGVIGQRVPVVDDELCRKCGKCAVESACPIHIAQRDADGLLKIDPDACNHCGRCIGKCPFKAVTEGETGYLVCIGGRWGKKTANGQPLHKVFTREEVMQVAEKALLLFREQGKTGERFADTIARLGFENVEAQLLSDDILARKDEIIGAKLHLVGGATC